MIWAKKLLAQQKNKMRLVHRYSTHWEKKQQKKVRQKEKKKKGNKMGVKKEKKKR